MHSADPSVPDKLAARLGASTVLGELLARVPDGVPVVVVGPARPLAPRDPPAVLAREDPPGGGPAAAVAAGVAALRREGYLVPEQPGGAAGVDVVVVCAGDAPWSPLAVPVLVAALRQAPPQVTVVVAVDGSGMRQPLLAVHRVPALLARLDGTDDLSGRAAGWLVRDGALEVEAVPHTTDDIDTPEQLALARRRSTRQERV